MAWCLSNGQAAKSPCPRFQCRSSTVRSFQSWPCHLQRANQLLNAGCSLKPLSVCCRVKTQWGGMARMYRIGVRYHVRRDALVVIPPEHEAKESESIISMQMQGLDHALFFSRMCQCETSSLQKEILANSSLEVSIEHSITSLLRFSRRLQVSGLASLHNVRGGRSPDRMRDAMVGIAVLPSLLSSRLRGSGFIHCGNSPHPRQAGKSSLRQPCVTTTTIAGFDD